MKPTPYKVFKLRTQQPLDGSKNAAPKIQPILMITIATSALAGIVALAYCLYRCEMFANKASAWKSSLSAADGPVESTTKAETSAIESIDLLRWERRRLKFDEKTHTAATAYETQWNEGAALPIGSFPTPIQKDIL